MCDKFWYFVCKQNIILNLFMDTKYNIHGSINGTQG